MIALAAVLLVLVAVWGVLAFAVIDRDTARRES